MRNTIAEKHRLTAQPLQQRRLCPACREHMSLSVDVCNGLVRHAIMRRAWRSDELAGSALAHRGVLPQHRWHMQSVGLSDFTTGIIYVRVIL
jgi:hypothetical protein